MIWKGSVFLIFVKAVFPFFCVLLLSLTGCVEGDRGTEVENPDILENSRMGDPLDVPADLEPVNPVTPVEPGSVYGDVEGKMADYGSGGTGDVDGKMADYGGVNPSYVDGTTGFEHGMTGTDTGMGVGYADGLSASVWIAPEIEEDVVSVASWDEMKAHSHYRATSSGRVYDPVGTKEQSADLWVTAQESIDKAGQDLKDALNSLGHSHK